MLLIPHSRRLIHLNLCRLLVYCFIFLPSTVCLVETESHVRARLIPSLKDVVEMARLSKIVYDFKGKNETYCDSFQLNEVRCHWYHHDKGVGTQVLLVSNIRAAYIAVVYAGTDDLRTSLEDADIFMKPFGNNRTIRVENQAVKVHAGFNNAIFTNGLWDEISSRLEALIRDYPHYQVWTTGHSLGAANSILTAVALAKEGHSVASINFGCPQTGNEAWYKFVNSLPNTKIWRVVLGWDLVARMPDLFWHVGHTLQIWGENHHKYDKLSPDNVEAYYQHYGNSSLGLAGVPPGWWAKPYAWIPGALSSHFVEKYLDNLLGLYKENKWVSAFRPVETSLDDDEWANPPDDEYRLNEFRENEY